MKVIASGNGIRGVSDDNGTLSWDSANAQLKHEILIDKAEILMAKAELIQRKHLITQPYSFKWK